MIPKKIHYIWIDRSENPSYKLPKIYQMCMMSTKLFNPDYEIILHTNKPIEWDLLRKEDFKVRFIERNLIDEAISFGLPYNTQYFYVAHMSDWLRCNYLKEEGGIYLDTDIVITRSFDDLLDKHFIVAKEAGDAICAGVILSEIDHPIIDKVLNTYRTDYHPREWVYNSQQKPYEYMKQDSSVTIIEQKLGYHYPYIGEEKLYFAPCEKIETPEDIKNYFMTRGHHLFGHIDDSPHLGAFEEAKDNNYIAQLGKYILNRYGVVDKKEGE